MVGDGIAAGSFDTANLIIISGAQMHTSLLGIIDALHTLPCLSFHDANPHLNSALPAH